MNYPINIQLKKSQAYLMLASGLPLLANGLFLISRGSLVLGGFCLMLVAFFSYQGIKLLRRKKLPFRIDTNGLYDHSTVSDIGHIDWEDIAGFRPYSILWHHFIVVDLHNPDEYINKQKGKLVEKIIRHNLQKHGSPVAISSGLLDIDRKELLDLLNNELQNYLALPEELRIKLREVRR